ncbi:methyltransferase domain-containing protein [Candidatus Bathyarchaeota archaeon]|nr:methyltransferase domain-containing protein [Candidatus Bathyarchaeota archaeon]
MDYKDLLSGQKFDNFWSMARRDLMSNLVRRFLEPGLRDDRQPRILNVGAGTGEFLESLVKLGKIHVLDKNEDVMDIVPKQFVDECKVADIKEIPYPSNYFDVILCFDVLEHVREDREAMVELHRVLTRDGLLICTVPRFPFIYSSHDRALGHQRRYSMDRIINITKVFTHVRIMNWNFSLSIPIAILRLLRRKVKSKEDVVDFPKPVNLFFYFILRLESILVPAGILYPFGLTMIAICMKRGKVMSRSRKRDAWK